MQDQANKTNNKPASDPTPSDKAAPIRSETPKSPNSVSDSSHTADDDQKRKQA